MTDRVFRTATLVAIVTTIGGLSVRPTMAQAKLDNGSEAQAESPPVEKAETKPKPENPPRPPSDVTAIDRPDDAGTGIIVKWSLSPDDIAKVEEGQTRNVIRYEILRQVDGEGDFELAGEANFQKESFVDPKCSPNSSYIYQVVAVKNEDSKSAPEATAAGIRPVVQWWDTKRTWFLVILLMICGAVIQFIRLARAGRSLKVRKIAGLEAVDEAVGRATEMGRSCLFVPGILDINDMQTVAGITVLSRVAGLAAEYDAMLEVPTSRSLVMTTARETVQAAYFGAGRPDAYNEDNIYYLTDEQFGYVAGVTGTMVRDKPAACFYMVAFFAESLILAETGNSIGAIQVAGTAMPS